MSHLLASKIPMVTPTIFDQHLKEQNFKLLSWWMVEHALSLYPSVGSELKVLVKRKIVEACENLLERHAANPDYDKFLRGLNAALQTMLKVFVQPKEEYYQPY